MVVVVIRNVLWSRLEQALFMSRRYASTKCVPLCEVVFGTVGELVVDATDEEDAVVAFPIDALAIDLTEVDSLFVHIEISILFLDKI
jgi:hypothetical protein